MADEQVALDFVARPDVAGQIASMAREEGNILVGGSRVLPDSDDLDSPISPGQVVEALELITLIFTTGKVALEFIKGLKDVLRQNESPDSPIQLRNPEDSKTIATIATHAEVDAFVERPPSALTG